MTNEWNSLPRFFARKFGLLVVALVLAACSSPSLASDPTRILFVGNSLIYTGNLPAVLDALGDVNGHPIHSEMLVQGGATLSHRVEDGSVNAVLANEPYDYVVLQERGGDLLCMDIACETPRISKVALQSLATTARKHGATPLYLGTYQGLPSASEALLKAEAEAAAAASVRLIAVSALHAQAVASHPDLPWHDPDGMHPGPQLQLLEAVLLYRELFGEYPDAAGLKVTAPMYTPRAKFFPPLLASEKVTVNGDMASGHEFSSEAVAIALKLAKGTM
ncbi:SGNH/GDSL hydrolase family protein [Lysobacter sp. F6437]|uniref:SGNH/GDSL hydrolase family protein n=1 Tax=Lysobacter sp. F6437 TaxID=3459296 RepID=UPI00403DC6A6